MLTILFNQIPFRGPAAATQTASTGSAAGQEIFGGAAAGTQTAGTGNAGGEEIYQGPAAATQTAGTGNAAGQEIFGGTAAATQTAGTGNAGGQEIFGGTAAATQTAGTGSAGGQEIYQGPASATQTAGIGAASGLLGTLGGFAMFPMPSDYAITRIFARGQAQFSRGLARAAGRVINPLHGVAAGVQTLGLGAAAARRLESDEEAITLLMALVE